MRSFSAVLFGLEDGGTGEGLHTVSMVTEDVNHLSQKFLFSDFYLDVKK